MDNKNANTGSRIILLEMHRSIDAIPFRDQHPHRFLLDCSVDLATLHRVISVRPDFPGAILMISRDREFLNQLVGSIVEIRQSRLLRYRGNYDDYLVQREAQAEQLLAAYKNQQRDIQRLQEFADRFRAKASKASQAQAKLKACEAKPAPTTAAAAVAPAATAAVVPVSPAAAAPSSSRGRHRGSAGRHAAATSSAAPAPIVEPTAVPNLPQKKKLDNDPLAGIKI